MVFEFTSEGIHGSIAKLVVYSDTHLHNFYNLGFGDKEKSRFTIMKEVKNINKKPTVLKVEKELDNYLNKGLFKEKIDKANEVLKRIGLPKFSK